MNSLMIRAKSTLEIPSEEFGGMARLISQLHEEYKATLTDAQS